jgi:hypothetical protein
MFFFIRGVFQEESVLNIERKGNLKIEDAICRKQISRNRSTNKQKNNHK